MTHQLTIEVPDDVFQPLVERAQAAGQSPEAVALNLVSEGVRPPAPGSRLLKWAGAFQSDVTDAAERHDYYIGQRLYDEMQGQ